ncbi:mitochondrial fission ELM1 family protein [Rhizobiales bacterium]|uniref:mitochondrial fission ELM1 family protein n=1 Tax=Hongsoonwoonella zoysiae TaxID=2821844 RepID=UPI00155FEC73|nr:mitochondrial fission ELM1 family protein [Hongsoonwoonella zoysiae]NRG17709.1 mitochondrial fission ELM1 family protein [Hongsoonwoonella zoysiae]
MNRKEYETGKPDAASAGVASVWVLTDGKAGDEAQCIGVAEALGAPFEVRRVSPRAPFAWAMPWGPIDPRDASEKPGSPLAAPFPDIVIASGRRAVAYLRHIAKASGGRTFTVFLKDPRTGTRAADFIWVAKHDDLRGPNVMVTVTAPHRIFESRLDEARRPPLPEIAALPSPRVAVLAGGDSRHHRFSPDDVRRFVSGLKTWSDDGVSLMMTASRRTPPALAESLRKLAATGPHLFWEGKGENPLIQYLANADAIVATADSTNMIGEAAATGRPVHVFHPGGGHAKINRFLAEMSAMGVVHPFPGALKTTTYEPVNSTSQIARAIVSAFKAQRGETDKTEH